MSKWNDFSVIPVLDIKTEHLNITVLLTHFVKRRKLTVSQEFESG